MTRRSLAMALVLLGVALAVTGIGLVSVPLALVVAGCAIAAIGLLAVEVPR